MVQDAIEALGLHDAVIEYEITSNRVDCYGVLGIAREAAATFQKKFVPPVVTATGNDEDVNDYIKVDGRRIKDLCPALLCKSRKKCQNCSVTEMDAEMTGCQRHPPDQQPGRYHKLCHGRIWSADACL